MLIVSLHNEGLCCAKTGLFEVRLAIDNESMKSEVEGGIGVKNFDEFSGGDADFWPGRVISREKVPSCRVAREGALAT